MKVNELKIKDGITSYYRMLRNLIFLSRKATDIRAWGEGVSP
jgi:hypothetical protein